MLSNKPCYALQFAVACTLHLLSNLISSLVQLLKANGDGDSAKWGWCSRTRCFINKRLDRSHICLLLLTMNHPLKAVEAGCRLKATQHKVPRHPPEGGYSLTPASRCDHHSPCISPCSHGESIPTHDMGD